MKDIFRGFTTAMMRSTAFSSQFFVLLDSVRRHTSLYSSKLGQFFATGSLCVVAAFFAWPFEVIKNVTQAET